MAASLEGISSALAARGLALRGAFWPEAADAVPPLPDGRAAGTVVLVGQAGGGAWRRFERERRAEPDPLDRWAARALHALAAALGAAVVLPGDGPPYAPFPRWAQRAGPVRPSPLGILIDPELGLWHAYRGALLLAERMPLPPLDDRPRPCDACDTRPCLSACPVGAFSAAGFDDAACARHVVAPAGAPCRSAGCLARRACPVGREAAYGEAQQRFHVEAFLRGRPGV